MELARLHVDRAEGHSSIHMKQLPQVMPKEQKGKPHNCC